jgi:hypothetical protein
LQPLHEGGIVGALEAAPATGHEAVRRGGSGKLNTRDKWIFRATAA